MRQLLRSNLIIGTLAAFVLLVGLNEPLFAANWQLVKHQDGIKIFTKPVKGSTYNAFKAVTKIKTSFDGLLSIIADTSSNCRWMHGCDTSHIIKKISFTERYIYQTNDLPYPLWDRDVIMHSVARMNKKGNEVVIRLKAVPRFCDKARITSCKNRDRRSASQKYVRISKAEGFYKLRKLSSHSVEVTWQMHAEPGGEVSSWITNSNLIEIPYETLSGLKSYARHAKRNNSNIKLAQRKRFRALAREKR